MPSSLCGWAGAVPFLSPRLQKQDLLKASFQVPRASAGRGLGTPRIEGWISPSAPALASTTGDAVMYSPELKKPEDASRCRQRPPAAPRPAPRTPAPCLTSRTQRGRGQPATYWPPSGLQCSSGPSLPAPPFSRLLRLDFVSRQKRAPRPLQEQRGGSRAAARRRRRQRAAGLGGAVWGTPPRCSASRSTARREVLTAAGWRLRTQSSGSAPLRQRRPGLPRNST